MPALIGSLFVSLTADFAGFQRNMQAAEGSFGSATANIRRNAGLTERSVTSLQRTTNSGIRPGALIAASRAFDNTTQRANLLRGALFATTAAFGGLGAALTSNVISRYLDTFTSLQNQIRAVSTDSADLAGTFSEVQKVADRSRSSLSAVATLYARLARAAPGESQDKLLRRVETINKALQLGGATAQEAASAAIQFSQAIQSNRLGGDELRAVLETPLGGELAKGMGIGIGALRKLSTEGKLTASVVLAALDKISGEVDGRFSKSFSTIDQALTVVDNKFIAYAGTLNDTYGITKLITGALGSFGDNLGTIIPLVAQLAGSFGVIFAGRLATGQFAKIVNGIKSVTDARKEALAIAKLENDQAQAAVANAQRRADAAKTAAPEAPRAFTKAVDRETAAAAAIEKERLGVLRREGELRQKLGAITAQQTVGSIKATNAVIDAENKLNASLGRRQGLLQERKDNRAATTQLKSTLTSGVKTLGPDVVAQQQKLVADRRSIAAQLATVDQDIARNREVLATRTVKAAALETEAERVATAERIALAKQLQAAQNQGAILRSQAQIQAGRIDNAKGALLGAGGTASAALVKQTAGELYDAERGATRAATALALAGKQAGALSIGFGIARGAVGSFVGFLGGPWGVAITGAIGLLTYFGIAAQENAQKIAAAQQAIADGLAMIGADDLSKKTDDEALALVDAKISAMKAQIEKVQFGMEDAAKQITDNVTGEIFSNITNLGTNFDKLGEDFQKVQDQFRAGALTFEEYRAALINLGADKNVLDGLIKNAGDAKLQFTQGLVVAYRLGQQLNILDGQKADIEVNIKLNDPAGIFPSDLARGRSRPPGDIQLTPLDTIDQSSAPQDLQPTDFFHKDLLGRANDQGNPALNTAQKIKDATEEIFQQGKEFGVTRAQAEAYAKETLDIAEAQRKAAAQTKSATKDYEKFADKLRELNETGAAAGLGEIDRQVVDFARSLKDGSKLMADYIKAVNSGDLSKAPKDLLEARKAFVQIAAASQSRDIVQKYGEGAQVTAQFAQQQEILNAAVASGAITADQAKLAFADFLGEFGKYDWIDKVTNAFGEFADTALSDFDNIGDAFKGLIASLEKTIIQATLIQPFQDWIKSALGQATGVANGGGSSGDIIGSLFSAIGGSGAKKIMAANQNASISAAAKAIQGIESGGNYQALGPVQKSGDRAYGAYQVMGANIPSWTKQATGTAMSPGDFLKNSGVQDAVFKQQFGASTAKYGNMSDAASVWFSGRPQSRAGNASDSLGTSTSAYVDKFNKNLETMGASADKAGSSLGGLNDNVLNVTKSIGGGVNGGSASGVNAFLGSSAFKPTPNGFNDMLGIPAGGGGAAGGGFGGIFTSIIDGIGGFLKGITDTIGGLFSSIFGGAGGGGGGFLTSILSGIGSIFGFAEGTNSAPRGTRWVGENGPELMNFRGGEKVTPMRRLQGVRMSPAMAERRGPGGADRLKIEWQDNAGVQRRTEKKSGPDGDVLKIIVDKMDEAIGSGQFDGSMGRRYGSRPSITKR